MEELSSKRNIVGPIARRIREQMIPPMTQERLARELQMLGWDISRFGISKIERGQREITDKEIVLIATALNVSIEKLFEQIGE